MAEGQLLIIFGNGAGIPASDLVFVDGQELAIEECAVGLLIDGVQEGEYLAADEGVVSVQENHDLALVAVGMARLVDVGAVAQTDWVVYKRVLLWGDAAVLHVRLHVRP